ncbi:MAG: redox-sensitive transcriptional activator SoxR [Comamonas sp.]
MKIEDDPLMGIGDFAQRGGVNASALRFYESLGLIESVRGASGRRSYHRSSLRRIAYIVFAQRVGFTLDEIAEQLARLPTRQVPTGGDWQKMSRVWQLRLDERIDELQRLRDSLNQCIGCGCLSLRHCKLHNPGDLCSQNGPGPRRWLGDPPPGTCAHHED